MARAHVHTCHCSDFVSDEMTGMVDQIQIRVDARMKEADKLIDDLRSKIQYMDEMKKSVQNQLDIVTTVNNMDLKNMLEQQGITDSVNLNKQTTL